MLESPFPKDVREEEMKTLLKGEGWTPCKAILKTKDWEKIKG